MVRKHGHDVKRGHGFIQERTRADGETIVYQARWPEQQRDGSITHRSQSYPTRDAAEDRLREVAREQRDGRYQPPSTLTVGDVLTQWLRRGRRDWSGATYHNYDGIVTGQIRPALGDVRLHTLTPSRVQHWIDGIDLERYQPTTVRLWITVLSLALNEAVRLELVPTNACSHVRRPRLGERTITTWTPAEAATFVATLPEGSLWRAVYTVALTTGMRPGEISGLRWTDVDLTRNVIHVRRTLTVTAEGVEVVGETTKTKRSRTVALTAIPAAALKAWRRTQAAEQLAAETWPHPGAVFTFSDGRLVKSTSWRTRHRALIARAGVTPITLHQLRHTAATVAMQSGTHPRIVADQLGHRSTQITLDMYTHPSAEDHRAASEHLTERLFGAADTTTSA